MCNNKFSRVIAAFCLLWSSHSFSFSNSDLQEVANSTTWQTLIHSWGGKPQINSDDFLLTNTDFSPLEELVSTLRLIKEKENIAKCRYPARFAFLNKQLKLNLSDSDFSQCDESFQKYLKHVPFDRLELVFASEIFSSASSMMGHIFLKASGENYRGVSVSHSLAYFTEITTLNPFKLFTESLLTGMPGFFTVRPFEKDAHQYIDIEERNLWQFELRSSKEKLNLLRLHLWELKDIDLVYYFQSYNCATLTLELLALLDESVLEHRNLFVTPVDVVKAVHSTSLLSKTEVVAAKKWLRHVIESQLSEAEIQQVLNIKNTEIEFEALSSIQRQYAALVSDKAMLNDAIEQEQIDLSQYKHPSKTPQDSAITGGIWHNNNDSVIQTRFLASGHDLYGDNRQYLHESELIIGNLVLDTELRSARTSLNELTLYSMKSLTPSTNSNPSWSSEFYLGYRPSFDAQLQWQPQGELTLGFGKAKQIHKDAVAYSMLTSGAGIYAGHLTPYGSWKNGLVTNLIYDTKFVSEVEWSSGRFKDDPALISIRSGLSWFPSQDSSVTFKHSFASNKNEQDHAFSLTYAMYF